MPTVLRIGPYRFFFYAGDGAEPPHVHVERDNGEAQFWLDPILELDELHNERGRSADSADAAAAIPAQETTVSEKERALRLSAGNSR